MGCNMKQNKCIWLLLSLSFLSSQSRAQSPLSFTSLLAFRIYRMNRLEFASHFICDWHQITKAPTNMTACLKFLPARKVVDTNEAIA